MGVVDETDETRAGVLAESLAVQLGGIAEVCREGLMAVAVEVGMATALAIMDQGAGALCGAWNPRDLDRDRERGGTTPMSVVKGGKRRPMRRHRVHAVDDTGNRAGEVSLAPYGVFTQRDLLSRVAVQPMLAGIATRSFERAGDPLSVRVG